jgi:L-amino acid N-acyltransferase YncA
MEVLLRKVAEDDWESIARIYKEGIDSGHATFESEIPTLDQWSKRHLKICRIVALVNNEIAGWAALSPVSARCVYAGVAEVSVYVADSYKGQKIGTLLLESLIKESEMYGLWTLQSSIFRENKASIRIHEKTGFRIIGFREKIGKMDDMWRDTLLLERRSKITGIE